MGDLRNIARSYELDLLLCMLRDREIIKVLFYCSFVVYIKVLFIYIYIYLFILKFPFIAPLLFGLEQCFQKNDLEGHMYHNHLESFNPNSVATPPEFTIRFEAGSIISFLFFKVSIPYVSRTFHP